MHNDFTKGTLYEPLRVEWAISDLASVFLAALVFTTAILVWRSMDTLSMCSLHSSIEFLRSSLPVCRWAAFICTRSGVEICMLEWGLPVFLTKVNQGCGLPEPSAQYTHGIY